MVRAVSTRHVLDLEQRERLLSHMGFKGFQIGRVFLSFVVHESVVEVAAVLRCFVALGWLRNTVAISHAVVLKPFLERSALLTEPYCSLRVAHLTKVVLIVRVIQVVGLLMSVQVGLLVEALIASWVRAAEWLLACVDPQVRF